MGNTYGAVGLAEGAADEIRKRICEQSLKPGDLIGTEEQLTASLGISRNALREALGRLRGLGIVSSRQGKGVFVAQTDPAETLGMVIPQYAIDHTALSELGKLRYSLELGAVGMAVKHATEADIAQLKHLAHELSKALAADDFHKVDEMDLEFHKTILSATGSSLLRNMQHIIVTFFHRGEREFAGWSHKEEPLATHADIAAAFARRDAQEAHALLEAHFRDYFDRWD